MRKFVLFWRIFLDLESVVRWAYYCFLPGDAICCKGPFRTPPPPRAGQPGNVNGSGEGSSRTVYRREYGVEEKLEMRERGMKDGRDVCTMIMRLGINIGRYLLT